MDYGIGLVYWGSPLPYAPVTDGILSKTDRNNQLHADYLSGIAVPALAERFEISPQRVYQILRDT